jgi:uncharacterized protein (DUF2141 family)
MKICHIILFFAAAALCYLLSVTGSGCAQIGMPTGGIRDSFPPVLLKSTPPNGATHFSGKSITFTFDEYVHLQDLQKYLLVSPTPKIIPNINYKFKTVTIRIRDTLQPNTTYSFQLGNALQDINENNPIHDFTYVFSTGAYVDSLRFSGQVTLAETGKPDSTLLVFLYKDLGDSAVYKEKPRYIARLDSAGHYQFKNLAEGSYNLFALKDESGQRMYNNNTQIFAFADSVVRITQTTNPVALFAYQEEKDTKPPAGQPAAGNKKSAEKKLKYTTSFSSGSQDILTPLTIQVGVPLKDFDSTKITLTDTLYHPLSKYAVSIDTTLKIITLVYNWTADTQYKLIIEKDFATDTLGDQLDQPDTLHFKSKKEGEYGSIRLNFSNLQKIPFPVLQFIKDNQVVYSSKLTSSTFTQKLFNPGEYELRILDDENGNGLWDPGSYHLKKQPEKVTSVPKKISVRADWENEADIIL